MERNEGTVDRLVRVVVLTPLLVVVALAAGVGTVVGVVALVLAAVMLLTGAVGSCPLYSVMHLRTNRSAPTP